jgi:hypothetical protein
VSAAMDPAFTLDVPVSTFTGSVSASTGPASAPTGSASAPTGSASALNEPTTVFATLTVIAKDDPTSVPVAASPIPVCAHAHPAPASDDLLSTGVDAHPAARLRDVVGVLACAEDGRAAVLDDVPGVPACAQSRRGSVTRDLPPTSAGADGDTSPSAGMADGASRTRSSDVTHGVPHRADVRQLDGELQRTPAGLDHAESGPASRKPDSGGSSGGPAREPGRDEPPDDRRAPGSGGRPGVEAEVSRLADAIGQQLAHVSVAFPRGSCRVLCGAPCSASGMSLPKRGRRRAGEKTRSTDAPATGRLRRCAGRLRPGMKPVCFRAATRHLVGAISTTRCRGGLGPRASVTWRPCAGVTTG